MRPLRATTALLVALLVTMSGFVLSSASAAPETAITIARTSDSPQDSGETFTYDIKYQCSDVDGASCNGSVITVPLGDAADFDPQVVAGPPVASWAVVGDNLVITLDSTIDAGTSSTIQLEITPPNYVTPDGVTWSLLPSVTGTNTPDATAPTAADGEVNAELKPTTTKTGSNSFRRVGQSLTWTISTACQLEDSGSLFASAMTVTDTLPVGFSFTSASGGGTFDSSARTVTWTYSNDETLPTSCTAEDGTGVITQTIVGSVGADATPGTPMNNVATVVATPYGGGQTVTVEDDATVQIVDDVNPPGSAVAVAKGGLGQLAGPLGYGDSAKRDYQTTYPGRWTALKGATGLSHGSADINEPPSTAWYTEISNTDGFEHEVRDAMPCLDNLDGTTYSSQAALCANPAFHPTTVQLNSLYGDRGTPPDGYQPTALLTDGTTINLEIQAGDRFGVPATAVGRVAEILLPRYEVSGSVMQIWIEGYADASLQDGDILNNLIEVEQYYGSTSTTPLQTMGDDGRIFITNAPQIGSAKAFGPIGEAAGGNTALTLKGYLDTLGQASDDLMLADLLPEGMTWADVTNAVSVPLSVSNVDGTQTVQVDVTAEAIDNYKGRGDSWFGSPCRRKFCLSTVQLSSPSARRSMSPHRLNRGPTRTPLRPSTTTPTLTRDAFRTHTRRPCPSRPTIRAT